MELKSRDIFTLRLKKEIDTDWIKVITGIRRCGKSYLLKLIKRELESRGIPPENILIIDFESLGNEHLKEYRALYEEIIRRSGGLTGKIYLLFDEIQEVLSWELAIRSFLVDLDCDIYLTGSNAHLLSGELATYLAGRYTESELLPLSFSEYLSFNSINRAGRDSMEDFFYDYLRYGGFPGLHNIGGEDDIKRQYLQGIYNSVVLKDVIGRKGIRDPELLERIVIYLMDNIGQIFSAKNIADYLKSRGRRVSTESVYSYVDALGEAQIIYPVKRYDIKGKKLLERLEKYYLSDLGLRYCLLGFPQNDIAQLLENSVYLELRRRGFSVRVGKQEDWEVDFIAEKGRTRCYLQVSYLLASEVVVEREYRPLRAIRDNYRKMVLSLDRGPFDADEGIEWMNCIDFLLDNDVL